MGLIDKSGIQPRTDSVYPPPCARMMQGRSSLRLGDAGGLTQFRTNEGILEPDALSSLRHWQHREDEFVMAMHGECTLVQDSGETVMRPGDCAAFPTGHPGWHHLIDNSDAEARFLVIGSRMNPKRATGSDVDLEVVVKDGQAIFTHKDGTPYQGDKT